MSVVLEAMETPAQVAAAIIKAQHNERERALDLLVLILVAALAYVWYRTRFPKAERNLAPTMATAGVPEIERFNWAYTTAQPANRSALANNPMPSSTRVPTNPSRGSDYTPP